MYVYYSPPVRRVVCLLLLLQDSIVSIRAVYFVVRSLIVEQHSTAVRTLPVSRRVRCRVVVAVAKMPLALAALLLLLLVVVARPIASQEDIVRVCAVYWPQSRATPYSDCSACSSCAKRRPFRRRPLAMA